MNSDPHPNSIDPDEGHAPQLRTMVIQAGFAHRAAPG